MLVDTGKSWQWMIDGADWSALGKEMEKYDDMRETIEKSARHLYGLVHARYIVTTRGLAKMVCLHPRHLWSAGLPRRLTDMLIRY